MAPIVERSVHAVTVLLVLAVAVAALKRWQRRKASRARRLLSLGSGKASIVYFHSPSCGVCRISQKPILDTLLAHVGENDLLLVPVDVTQNADVARAWGVTTVPSTYVIDPAGEVVHVNNGLASEPTLRRQVSGWRRRAGQG